MKYLFSSLLFTALATVAFLPFNRTIVELKRHCTIADIIPGLSFNRTIVELKHNRFFSTQSAVDTSFNRTIVELKRELLPGRRAGYSLLLIEP